MTLTLTPELQEALARWFAACETLEGVGFNDDNAPAGAYRAALDAEPEHETSPLTRELVEALEAQVRHIQALGWESALSVEGRRVFAAYRAYRGSSEAEPETRLEVGDRVQHGVTKKRGTVKSDPPKTVYVQWDDGASGRYTTDYLEALADMEGET